MWFFKLLRGGMQDEGKAPEGGGEVTSGGEKDSDKGEKFLESCLEGGKKQGKVKGFIELKKEGEGKGNRMRRGVIPL